VKVDVANGLVVVQPGSGTLLPSAEQIYSVVFEGKKSLGGVPVVAADFAKAGVKFSDSPVLPAIRLEASTGAGEPEITSGLAGIVGDKVVTASRAPGFQADYVIAGQTWYPLPLGAARDYERFLASCGAKGDKLTVGQYFEVLARDTVFRIDDQAARELTAANLAPLLDSGVPPGLRGTPYPYQRTGIGWLGFMVRHGVGTILADEMGLGKTLQAIGVLAAEISDGRSPNLVLCPATLLENWRRELERFAPGLDVQVHAGSRRTGRAADLKAASVTITSYDTMAGDISLFRAVKWNLVIADEAQNIRNPEARRTTRAKEIPRRVGIAVSGTPVENRLRDLWSIADFVLPGYLGTLDEFSEAHPNTDEGARELEPFVSAIMLRRRVADVAKDLPERIDVPVALVLDDASARAYEEIRHETAEQYPQAAELTALIKLRLFCSHPWAAGKLEGGDPVARSSKLERCLEILEEIAAAGEKALVFTSFNETADLLAATISRKFGFPTGKINGSVPVPERQGIVDAFGAHEGTAVLVLNPKAAGTGLNITAANHVIHYNLEWNPAVEDQASARAYRRGQTLPVTVHRMFYAGTVEEVINERMERKRAIAGQAVVGTTGDADDLADIVKALQRSPLATANGPDRKNPKRK
jgi:SNF2 family DNA or RNA helicase